MADARVEIDPGRAIGRVDRRLHGAVLEHMGRAIYGGIHEPGHPQADGRGWRTDVLALVHELGVSTVRYPGGNFVSGYSWEDGVGPPAGRPTRVDPAWRSIESNAVGTDEFLEWTRLARVEPMLAVNLGSRGAAAARDLVEYCNGSVGSPLADRRAANGHVKPYGVPLWCLGNEMDGPWQIGYKTAIEYGRLAAEAGRLMHEVDPLIELVVCGSSSSKMASFGSWEATVLDLTWEVADHISLHSYFDPADYASVGDYLACSIELERMIDSVARIVDTVAARKGPAGGRDRQIGLSVDEWNVWRMTDHRVKDGQDRLVQAAPALAEDEQDVADALAVGCLLISLLNHADRVRIACIAQLVNVIPVIRTVNGGPAWRQTSFYPFADVARYGRGEALRLELDGPTYGVAGEGQVPAITASAIFDPAGSTVTVFAVNRLDRRIELEASLHGLDNLNAADHRVLAERDLRASNALEHRDQVVPRRVAAPSLGRGRLTVGLPARSWDVIRLTAT